MALVGLLSSVMHACYFRKLEKKVRKRNIPKVDVFIAFGCFQSCIKQEELM